MKAEQRGFETARLAVLLKTFHRPLERYIRNSVIRKLQFSSLPVVYKNSYQIYGFLNPDTSHVVAIVASVRERRAGLRENLLLG